MTLRRPRRISVPDSETGQVRKFCKFLKSAGSSLIGLRARSGMTRLAAPFAAGLLLTVAVGGSAQAGLFDFLFRPRQESRPAPAPVPQQQQPQQRSRPAPAPVVSTPKARGYCVRTCDGYYFATGFIRSQRDEDMQTSMCEASCSGGQMVLYKASGSNDGSNGNTKPAIESAVDKAGALYTALPTAYAFRDSENPACTCQSNARGLPQIPISVDPTLRNGDIVVMPDGLKVFRGAGNVPHPDTDFTSVASSKALSGVVRQQVLSLEQRIATPQ
ncbi:hypothetical protein C5L14_25625 [Labrys okinawensis]|uniref:DUF2865 domain-containing protein n=2 Tax=Labrys okinawensis TaxID=346911 RepID=A0A2S9Q5F8_9HYPH|nr:hypothetical protein C5L14_25625 [Labrys okinawensis]